MSNRTKKGMKCSEAALINFIFKLRVFQTIPVLKIQEGERVNY